MTSTTPSAATTSKTEQAPQNRTNCIVTLDSPSTGGARTTTVAEPWSTYYKEQEDTFAEFAGFDPNHVEGGAATTSAVLKRANTGSFSGRHLSSRLLSGQFENEVARSWEEDWDDEDPDDTFDAIMAKVARQNISALGQQSKSVAGSAAAS